MHKCDTYFMTDPKIGKTNYNGIIKTCKRYETPRKAMQLAMNNTKVSAIIPAYNEAQTIHKGTDEGMV